jgi:hypothetical protein
MGVLLNINHTSGIVLSQKQFLKQSSHFTAFSMDFDKSVKNK